MLGDEASHFNVDDRNQTLAQAAGSDTAFNTKWEACKKGAAAQMSR
jgi:hypothetical protein